MNEKLWLDYQNWTKAVQAELRRKPEWIKQYKNYAECMINNVENYKDMRKSFRRWDNLDYYLTIGNVKEYKKFFDIRYLGQSIGNLMIDDNEPYLKVEPKADKSGKPYFGYNLGAIEKAPWRENKGKAADFRRFYKSAVTGLPRQKEHMVESALFAELEKKSSVEKSLCGITPVCYANTRIHMKTALKASSAKDGVAAYSSSGGEIDVFCRLRVGKESQLTVIEVKDENKSGESFDVTMKQALAYAVFIRELWHSEAGKPWREVWGLSEKHKENADKKGLTINAVVAMPEGVTKPDYCGECINLKNDNSSICDRIALHYITIVSEINEHNARDVKFDTSMDK